MKNPKEAADAAFERALGAFAGLAVGEPDETDQKMFTIVTAGASHTRITAQGFSVLWALRRAPFTYLPSLAAQLVATLRLHAPARSFAAPFEIDGAALARLALVSRGPRWFWVTRSTDAIVVDCRPATIGASPPAIPAPLAPWSPAIKVLVRFDPPRRCAHCGVSPERFRLFDEAVVCLACGRSELVRGLDLAGATVEEVG